MQEEKKFCQQCKEAKSLLDFSHTGKKICYACEQKKLYLRHCRLEKHKEIWSQQQECAEQWKQELERKVSLRAMYEAHCREQELWYLQQPDRFCRGCHQVLPALSFGGIPQPHGFILHARCKICHEAFNQQRQSICCLCLQKTARQNFLSHYHGYALSCCGTSISLCCKDCEVAFEALSHDLQVLYIRTSCQKTFPTGQNIYAEIDPLTDEIRYIGRTSRPMRRHLQHLSDVSSSLGVWGSEKKSWYTRSNWMQMLADEGRTPYMKILQSVAVSPLVVEWELRYIWYGIQQGWRLLNVETMDDDLVIRVKASRCNFLTVPFEYLIQQRFFLPYDFVSFLHQWY